MKEYIAKDKTITYKALVCAKCDKELVRLNYGEDKVMLVCVVCDKVYWATPKEIGELLTE